MRNTLNNLSITNFWI